MRARFVMQKRRFCKTQLAKLCKIMQKIAKICKKICIYKKKVLSLQRVSEESRNEPQKVNKKTTKK